MCFLFNESLAEAWTFVDSIRLIKTISDTIRMKSLTNPLQMHEKNIYIYSLRYHLGSVALGSFIIAIVQFIRLVLEYIDRKTKQQQNKVQARNTTEKRYVFSIHYFFFLTRVAINLCI